MMKRVNGHYGMQLYNKLGAATQWQVSEWSFKNNCVLWRWTEITVFESCGTNTYYRDKKLCLESARRGGTVYSSISKRRQSRSEIRKRKKTIRGEGSSVRCTKEREVAARMYSRALQCKVHRQRDTSFCRGHSWQIRCNRRRLVRIIL